MKKIIILLISLIFILNSCSNTDDLKNIEKLESKIIELKSKQIVLDEKLLTNNDYFSKNLKCFNLKDKIQNKLESKKSSFGSDIHVEEIFYSSKYNSCLYIEHTSGTRESGKYYYNRRLFDILDDGFSSHPIEACMLSSTVEDCKNLDLLIVELKK